MIDTKPIFERIKRLRAAGKLPIPTKEEIENEPTALAFTPYITEEQASPVDMEHLTTHPVKKSDLGFHGNLFGGQLLSWLDAAAVAYAMQLCDSPRLVTVSLDKCVFEKPSKEGQLIKIFGYPAGLGTTSVTLYIEARAHNVRTGKQYIILKTNMKFVYVDEDNQPIPLKDKSRARIEKLLSK